MRASLIDKKIEYWQNQLLDLGKRNKMINYRETKRSTLRLIEPSFSELFRRVALEEEELTFQRPVDRNSDIRTYSVLSLMETLSCPIPVSVGDIKTEGNLIDRQKTLKQIRAKSRLALDEQGINILYMVAGFIEWREKNDIASAWIKSPLVLVPVTLALDSLNSPYTLKKYDDDVVVNPTLAYLFERDYGIVLPALDLDDKTIESFMDEMEKLVDKRGWRIVRQNSLGLVSFLKISMYKDLCNNWEGVKSNPIIRAFSGAQNALPIVSEELYDFKHDKIPSIENFQVVNADSSQQDAILMSQKGISFVMQGPPGTGKSQTITNIIAQALAEGKKVLFVSEKAAALEVVHRRLSEVHLDDFCLALHSYKANKKEVLNELEKSLSLKPIKVKAEETAKLTELDTLKESLGKYVFDIHKEIMPLEMSVYEVYGELVALEDTSEFILEDIGNIENMSRDQLNRLDLIINDFDKAKGKLGDTWYKNPWNGTIVNNVSHDFLLHINEKFTRVLYRMKAVLDDFKIIEALGEHCDSYVKLNNLENIRKLINIYKDCQNIPWDWIQDDIFLEKRMVQAKRLNVERNAVNHSKKYIDSIYKEEFYKIDADKKLAITLQLKEKVEKLLNTRELSLDEYINYVYNESKIISELYVNFDKIIHETADLCKKWEIKPPCTTERLFFVYEIANILSERHLVFEEWFNKNPEELFGDFERYDKICAEINCLVEQMEVYFCNIVFLKKVDILSIYEKLEVVNKNEFLDAVSDCKFSDLIKDAKAQEQQYIAVKKLWDELKDVYNNILINKIDLPNYFYDLDKFVRLIDMLLKDIKPSQKWLDINNDVEFEETIAICEQKQRQYRELKEKISENWGRGVFEFDANILLARFRTEYLSVFKIFKKAYRNDMKVLKGQYRNTDNKLKKAIVIEMLEQLEKMENLFKWFTENDTNLKQILGEKYIGVDTDFMTIVEDRKSFKECCALEGIGLKAFAYVDKYDTKHRPYYMLASELVQDISNIIYNGVFKENYKHNTITDSLEYQSENIAAIRTIHMLYEDIKDYLFHSDLVTVSEYYQIIKKAVDYQKCIDKRNALKDIINEKLKIDIAKNDLEEIKQGILAINRIKNLVQDVSETLKKIMSERNYKHNLEYTKSDAENTVKELCKKSRVENYKKISNIMIKKKIEELLFYFDKLRSECDEIKEYHIERTENIDIIGDLEKLKRVQAYQKGMENNKEALAIMFGRFYSGVQNDWDNTLHGMEKVYELNQLLSLLMLDKKQGFALSKSNENGIQLSHIEEHILKLIAYKKEINWICDIFDQTLDFGGQNLTKVFEKWNNCLEQIDTLDLWIDYRDCRKKCTDNGLEQFVTAAEGTCYTNGTLANSFMKMFYLKWIEKVCSGIESLAQFRTRIQNGKIDRFCELDNHQLLVAQMRIREKLISEMPNYNNFNRATDEMGTLVHELNKKRKIMPLRKLFRTIPNLLLKLKPCFMMSPLSVSYFLEAETYKFNMVIFDEASQIFPQDAVGAICRGKQVIIAGDSKQLPPTSFFSSNTSNVEGDFDTDDGEEDIIFDSILEEATNSLPNRSLLWHYRSRNEDLISFSNQEIYRHELITFPSSRVSEVESGVEYIYVEDGVYSGRCNIKEARKCVELIKEHIEKYPERTLGIIAFSEKQQATIEEEVQKFRENNLCFEQFFSEDKEEPFFIKNLENVQGDERDTIIFSICYAKDDNGKMFMRFGPLGHQGGERRLNVAITRAKYNVKLVGSIMPYDIDLNNTKYEGVKMLRNYIEFAIKGDMVLRPHKNPNALYETDEFSDCIFTFLQSKGYKIKQNVGNSDYKIDIVVEHPKYSGCYVAGIECDGNSYLVARTTRDREHLRKTILEQMGWKMFRVWSTEWVNNYESEHKRLLDFVDESIKTYSKSEEKITPTLPKKMEAVQIEVLQKVEKESDKLVFPYYQIGDWSEVEYNIYKGNLENLAERIRVVIEVEQPIHIDILYRRLARAFGNEKATKPVKNTINQALNRVMAEEIVIEEGFIRFKNFTNICARVPYGTQERSIEYISKPEIADAMKKVIENSLGIEKEALCAEVTSIFGYERMGPKITKTMNDTICYMIEKNMVYVIDGKMQMKEA